MRRPNHDLSSSSRRLARLANEFDGQVREVAEFWKDDVGRGFLGRHAAGVAGQLQLLVAELAVAVEEFEAIARQLQDNEQL